MQENKVSSSSERSGAAMKRKHDSDDSQRPLLIFVKKKDGFFVPHIIQEDANGCAVPKRFIAHVKQEQKQDGENANGDAAVERFVAHVKQEPQGETVGDIATEAIVPRIKQENLDCENAQVQIPSTQAFITHVKQEKLDCENAGAESSSQGITIAVPNISDTSKISIVSVANSAAHGIKQEDQNKQESYSGIMEKVVFVISGFLNPERSEIRNQGLAMGAKYKTDWDSTCTHLICAFVNTPKYSVVHAQGGRIVTKNWIYDCYKKKELLPWQNYALNRDTESPSEDESDEMEVEVVKEVKKLGPDSTVESIVSEYHRSPDGKNCTIKINWKELVHL